MEVLAGMCFFLEVLGQSLFPYLLQFQEAAPIPWLVAPFCHCQNQERDAESLPQAAPSLVLTSSSASLFPF